MTVIYDLLGFQNRDHGERGIARYVLQLALALEQTSPGLVSHYLVDHRLPFPAGAERLVASGKVIRYDSDDPALRPGAGGVFIAGSLFEMDERLDRVLPIWARSPRWATMAVLYDLIPLKFRDWYLQRADVRHAYTSRTAALAELDHLLAISQASCDDAVSLLNYERSHITVIGAGADARFRRPSGTHGEVAEQLVAEGQIHGLAPGYILFPSGIERRKNIERTIEAYSQLPPEMRQRHQLVLVCRLDDYAREMLARLTAETGIGGQLLATDFVDDATLCRLYQGAELVVFPSIYEGFGLPVLEAMQCGAPVICADSSSLKEVQTLAEARFDPFSTDAVAEALQRALTDDGLRERLRGQELPPFTWKQAAELTTEAVGDLRRRMLARRPPGRPESLPRLAVVSPLPPQHSGIATYAYRLLEGLRHHCDVTVFVDGDAGEVSAPEGVSVAPLSRMVPMLRGGEGFDRILYFMGNSRFHVEMLDMLRRYPGWVLLHDVRLSGLYSEVQRLDPGQLVEGSVGATLSRLYPDRYRPAVEAMTSIPAHTAHRFGIWMTREVAELAQQVVVHSHFGANLVMLDAGVEASVLFPLPCPSFAPDEQQPEPVGTGGPAEGPMVAGSAPPTIATFGIVSPVKRPELLVAALPTLLESVPDVRLAYVGEIEDHHRRELEVQAGELGVAHCLDFVGFLDGESFQQAQRSATVAVQLRSMSNGESSAAVAELMAFGVPTVVSDLGAMSELPDDAVVKVDTSVGGPELGELIAELLTDPGRRAALAEGAQAYARVNSFSRAAASLAKTLFA